MEKILNKFNELRPEDIDLAICYVSVNSENLEKISYTDLLDKFLISNSKELVEESERVEEAPADEELSLG